MSELGVLFKALDMALWELSEAFSGLPDGDVWVRPNPKLLSVGELAAHVAYWEAQSFFGEEFESPLTVASSRYYTTTVDEPFSLSMSAEEVLAEVRRVHEACKAEFAANPPSADEVNVHRGDWTWSFTLQYQAFHVAYHTGQMYSVRHLLGHETVDN